MTTITRHATCPKAKSPRSTAGVLASSGALCLLLGMTHAIAQTPTDSASGATAPATSSDNMALEEITVTAEKRASTVQSTPISITALSQKDLEQQGITSIEDVVHSVPGVSFRSAGPGQTELEMRGLSSAGGAAPTVGYYLDDTPLTPPAQALNGKVVVDPNLYDISRVEVLRGPQGTLYGSGSMGGTVRIISNQPELTGFSGTAELDGSGTDGSNGPNGTANVAFNVPLIDDIAALRIVGTEKWASGYVDRIVVEPFPIPTNDGCKPTAYLGCNRGNLLAAPVAAKYKDVNWEHLEGGRAMLLIRPNADLSIASTVMFQQINQGGENTFDSPPGISPVLAHYQPADIPETYSDRIALYSTTISYNMSFATFTSATSYWHRQSNNLQDQAEGLNDAYGNIPFNTNTDQSTIETDTSSQISEELRLASDDTGRLKWIVGGFYSHLNSVYHEFAATPYCVESVGGCAANPDGIAINNHVPYKITQFAGFGELAWHITPTLTGTVGARYATFKNDLFTSVAGIFGPSGNGSFVTFSSSGSDHSVTPKFNLAYLPTPDLTLYATASEGFRPSGVNQPLPLTGPNGCAAGLAAIGLTQAPLTYKPDSIWNYELGEKARFLNESLTINADVYYIRWSRLQENIDLPCGTPYADNVGEARSYGPELEVSYNITPHISVDANAVYTHATITQASATSGLAAGTKLQNVPEYTENTSISYHTTVADDKKLTFRLANSLVGPTTDIAYAYVVMPTYDLLNFRALLESEKWDGSLYIDNVTNKHAELTANTTSVTFNLPAVTRFAVNQPLTIGIDLHYRF